MAHKILLTKISVDFLKDLELSNKNFKKSTFIKAIIIAFVITNKKKSLFTNKEYNPYLSILNRYLIEDFVIEEDKDIDEILCLKNKEWVSEISIAFNKNDLKYLNSLFEYKQFQIFKKNNMCLSCFINTVLYVFYKFNLFLKANYNDGWNYLKRFDEFKQDILNDVKNGVKDFYTKKFDELVGTKDLKIWVLLIKFYLVDVVACVNTKNVVNGKKVITNINIKKLEFDLNVIKKSKF